MWDRHQDALLQEGRTIELELRSLKKIRANPDSTNFF